MIDKWFFYILRCKDGSLYSGITTNLPERIRKHNAGTAAKYTRGRLPVVMVHSESLENISEARRREEQVKRWTKSRKESLIKESIPPFPVQIHPL